MSDFTYDKPDDSKYHQTLLAYLKKKGETKLYNLVKKAKCYIESSGTFSRRRWNGLWTQIVFQIPMSDFENVSEDDRVRLASICDTIMSPDVGFDVMNVEFTPLIDATTEIPDLEDDLGHGRVRTVGSDGRVRSILLASPCFPSRFCL